MHGLERETMSARESEREREREKKRQDVRRVWEGAVVHVKQ